MRPMIQPPPPSEFMSINDQNLEMPITGDRFTVKTDEPFSISEITETTPPTATTDTSADSEFTGEVLSHEFSIRGHRESVGVPLLMLCRYMSTIWMSEIVTTSFTSQTIQQTAVSICYILEYIY